MQEFSIPITNPKDGSVKHHTLRGEHLSWGMRRFGYAGRQGVYVDVYHDVESGKYFYVWQRRLDGKDGELLKSGMRSYKTLEKMARNLDPTPVNRFVCEKLGVDHLMRDQIVEEIGDD